MEPLTVVNSNNPTRRVTLRDIARRAGVSVMTVSRALRKDTAVSPRLRARLRRLAARLGYCPDPHLSALVAYRQRIRPPADHAALAYLTTGRTRDEFRASMVARDALLGAETRGRQTGYQVVPVWTQDLVKRYRDPGASLLARGFRGVIVAPLIGTISLFDMDWSRFSCVSVGYSLQQPSFHKVASHLFQDMILAFTKVRAHGYRRPALLMSRDLDSRTLHQFHGAFLFQQQSLPAHDRLPVMWSAENVRADDLGPFIERHAPDVLFSIWPLVSDAVKTLGLRFPRDLGFVDLCLEAPDGLISGVFQDFQTIGRAAVDRVNLLLQIGERGPPPKAEVTSLYGEWAPGKTLHQVKKIEPISV